jgi:hypothetical protein
VDHLDSVSVTTSSNQSGFVNTVGNIRSRETRGKCCKATLEVLDVFLCDNVSQVNSKDLLTSIHGRLVDGNVSVETTRTHESLIQNISAIGTSEDNDL